MNCSYFAIERHRTLKVNKKLNKNKQKQIQTKTKNNNKEAHKPKQNKTNIYKQANEEYITHA